MHLVITHTELYRNTLYNFFFLDFFLDLGKELQNLVLTTRKKDSRRLQYKGKNRGDLSEGKV